MSEEGMFLIKRNHQSGRVSTFIHIQRSTSSSPRVRKMRFRPITLCSSSWWTCTNAICDKLLFSQSGMRTVPQMLKQEEKRWQWHPQTKCDPDQSRSIFHHLISWFQAGAVCSSPGTAKKILNIEFDMFTSHWKYEIWILSNINTVLGINRQCAFTNKMHTVFRKIAWGWNQRHTLKPGSPKRLKNRYSY